MELDRELAGPGLELGTGQSRDNGLAVEQWTRFLAHCLAARLDTDAFNTYVSLLHSKHPLPPSTIADLCLRPQPANGESLDPRIPRYIQLLYQRKLIDTSSILQALLKYSTSHAHSGATGTAEDAPTLRWGSSYASEEVIFYRLTKAVGQGTGIRTASDALEVCKIMANWMTLFTSASADFAQDIMGQLRSSQSREEMEAARAAFVMLLLGICENQTVLSVLSRPVAHGACRGVFSAIGSGGPADCRPRGTQSVVREPGKLHSDHHPERVADCWAPGIVSHGNSCGV